MTDPALASLPWMLRRLVQEAIVDAQDADRLAREGIVSAEDLACAIDENRIIDGLLTNRQLTSAANILHTEREGITLGRAVDVLDALISAMRSVRPDLLDLTPAGDVRRAEAVVETMSIVASASDPEAALEVIGTIPGVRILHHATRRALVEYQQVEVDIRLAPPEAFGTELYTATGSRRHLADMRARRASPPTAAREADVYSAAGLQWIPPELRQGAGEVEAAAASSIPTLIAREDIRGDLHMHTTYSDGRDRLATMVQAAAALGYEYIAITDHSERAAAGRTVTPDALLRQRDEIETLRHRFPNLVILHGAEVDIMPDGSLDFPDDVLAALDIVLASLHDRHGHDASELTRRCLAAIQHPLVNIITHPANRLVGRDAGYDLDFPAIYAAAASTGTALEIDGAPMHLDLEGARAREAVSASVTVTIDSDCHRATLLDRQMRLGVGTARRGWVEPRHVLNTRPIDEVRAFLSAKRSSF